MGSGMKTILVLPILIPLTTAIFCLLTWKKIRLQRFLGLFGAGALFVSGITLLFIIWNHGLQSTQTGGWPAPFGITLVADLFSALMVVLNGLIGITIMMYSLVSIDKEREAYGYYPLLHFLLMGVSGAFMTGDIFNLYVWFEVMLIASFVLMAMGGERGQMEGALKYVTLNLLSSAIFLAALGILYGKTGTLNMAQLALILNTSSHPGFITTLAMLFLVAFGIKSAVFPLFFWLPASYHTPPAAISALFSGLLTKVGVYALIRIFTLIFIGDIGYTHYIILIIAGFTMVTGVLGAVTQNEFRRILSFHIVSQIGYIIMGLGLFTPLGIGGSIFFIAHNIVAKTNLFLVSGVVFKIQGSYELKKLGGLYSTKPFLALLFLIPALSLAGIPPLSGFFAKLSLIKAGLAEGQYLIVVAALGVGLLTLFSMIKIWNEAFWKAPQRAMAEPVSFASVNAENTAGMLFPIGFLALVTVLISIGAQGLFVLSMQAAEQLLTPSLYIETVLGGK